MSSPPEQTTAIPLSSPPEEPTAFDVPENEESSVVPADTEEGVGVELPGRRDVDDGRITNQPNEDSNSPEKILRRSERVSHEPDRLVVNWKCKDYDKKTNVQYTCATACCSIDYQKVSILSRMVGEGGINGND